MYNCGMVKKRTPQQEALSRAKKMPERRFFLSKRMCYGRGSRPCKWSFFTNWTGFTISLGEPKVKYYGQETPESRFLFEFATRPFSIMCFWERKRILWLGDWEWKKSLSDE